jgi:hypothetical protein
MQLALSYNAAHAGAEIWQRQIVWLRRVVDVLGHKFVAGELDISPSTLTDALLERERKSVKGEWIAKLLHMADEGLRRDWFAIVCPAVGFEVPEPVKTRTAEERLADLERVITERLGSLGEQLLREVKR